MALSALIAEVDAERLAWRPMPNLTSALRQLFAVAEAYPELRASENFQGLQAELSETENRIGHTRDNLARLGDLREEVEKHLGRLKRQAAAAH